MRGSNLSLREEMQSYRNHTPSLNFFVYLLRISIQNCFAFTSSSDAPVLFYLPLLAVQRWYVLLRSQATLLVDTTTQFFEHWGF